MDYQSLGLFQQVEIARYATKDLGIRTTDVQIRAQRLIHQSGVGDKGIRLCSRVRNTPTITIVKYVHN